MNGEHIPAPVAKRLQQVAQMEAGLAQRLEQLGDSMASKQLQRMQSTAEQHYETLRQLSESRGIALSTVPRRDAKQAGASDSAQLEEAATAATALASAYGALYATARLSFEGGICDVANRHATEWVAELLNAFELLPVAVIHELVREGEECRCICPACGIGACLCMRNSIETVRTQWGRPALEPSEGIELRIPPRGGSQLADAGLQQGDRILAIDGEAVHDNRELQQALRRGDMGQPRTAVVVRGDSRTEISIARVSDLP